MLICIQLNFQVSVPLKKNVNTHPPNKANFSFPSTLQHKMLPPEQTFHVFGEPIQEDPVDESATSIFLMLAFPLVVHVSRVQCLKTITTSK